MTKRAKTRGSTFQDGEDVDVLRSPGVYTVHGETFTDQNWFRASQMGISSKILEMSKSQFVSNDQIQALKEISFHSNILKFKEKNLDFKNLSGHAKISQKAKVIKDLIYSGASNFG